MKNKFLKLMMTVLASILFLSNMVIANAEEVEVSNYADFKTNVEAGGEIKLTDNINITATADKLLKTEYAYLLSVNKDTTINLNGHTITWDIGTTNEDFSSTTTYTLFYVSGLSTMDNNTLGSYSNAVTNYVADPAILTITDTENGRIIIKPDTSFEGSIKKVMAIGLDKYEIDENGKVKEYQYTSSGVLKSASLAKMEGQVINIDGGTIDVDNNSTATISASSAITSMSATPLSGAINMSAGKILINKSSSSNVKDASGIYFTGGIGVTLTGGIVEVIGGYSTSYQNIYGVSGNKLTSSNAIVAVKKVGDASTGALYVRALNGSSSQTNVIDSGKYYVDAGLGTTSTTFNTGIYSVIANGGTYNFDVSPYVNPVTSKGSNEANDTATIFGGSVELDYTVAPRTIKVVKNVTTNKEYISIITAVEEATEGDTIRLLADDTILRTVLTIDKSLTIDLNGNDISMENYCASSTGCGIYVTADVTDTVVFTDSQASSHAEAGTLNGSVAVTKGRVSVEKINIHPLSSTGLLMNGLFDEAFLDVKGTNILVDSPSSSWNTGFSAIQATGRGLITISNYSDTYKFIANVNAFGNKKAAVIGTTSIAINAIINSGTFNISSESAQTAIFLGTSSSSSFDILGGEFNITGTNPNISPTVNLNITGGLYNINLAENGSLAQGYQVVANGTKYEVLPDTDSFQIGDNKFITLASAISSAQPNDEIILLKDYTENSTVTIDKNITFNLGEYELKLNGKPALYVKDGVTSPFDTSKYEVKFTNEGYTGYYGKFDDAFGNLGNKPIVLNKNANVNKTYSVFSGSKTIDLNGYNLIYTGANNYFLDITTSVMSGNDANVSIINSAEEESTLNGAIYAQSVGSKLVLNIGTRVKVISNNNTLSLLGNNTNDESVIVNIDGKVVSESLSAIAGNSNYSKTIINVRNGSVLDGTGTGIYNPQDGIINVTGGSIIGKNGIIMKSGTLNVTSGTITSTGEFDANPTASNGGGESTGAAITLSSNDAYKNSINVNISGGSFISENGNAIKSFIPVKASGDNAAEHSHVASFEITGGNFKSAENKKALELNDYREFISKKVTGGKYTTDVSSYVTDSYVSVENYGIDKNNYPYVVELEMEFGRESYYIKGSNSSLTFISGDYTKFTSLEINGSVLSASEYISYSEEGKTAVALKRSYLESLELGSYVVTMKFDGANESNAIMNIYAELTFTDSNSYNIPALVVGTEMLDIDVSAGVTYGTKPYKFMATGLPKGISITSDGVIYGVPKYESSEGEATIFVTDANEKTASIKISYGSISSDAISTFEIPDMTLGKPITNVSLLGGVEAINAPYVFLAINLPNGLTVNNDGIISGTPKELGSEGSTKILAIDENGIVKTLTVNYGSVNSIEESEVTLTLMNYNKVKIEFTEVDGATNYKILKKVSTSKNYVELTTITDETRSYEDNKVNSGTTYSYMVIASNDYDESDSGAKSIAVRPLSANISVSKVGYNSVNLSWNKVDGASGYVVYRSTSENGRYSRIATINKGTTLTYNNTSLNVNTTYYYKIKSYRVVNRKNIYSNYSNIVSAKPYLKTSTIETAVEYYSKARITWARVSGASGYVVYRSESSDSSFVAVATISGYKNTFYDDSKSNTTGYYYKIRSYRYVGLKKKYSEYSNVILSKKLDGKINLTAKSYGYNEITLSFNKVENATSYQIYRATSKTGTYSLIKTLNASDFESNITYVDSKLQFNKTYYYKVRAVFKDKTSYASAYTKTVLASPVVTGYEFIKGIQVDIAEVFGASGYEVYRSTSENGEYELIKKTTERSILEEDLEFGTYYYKVRAYKTVGTKTYYGSFSSVFSESYLDHSGEGPVES